MDRIIGFGPERHLIAGIRVQPTVRKRPHDAPV
jgi:hypothetical protein